MKNIYIISTVAFAMLSCMASSPRQSLQARLFGTWRASDDQIAVFQIDKDSLYYIDEDPIVAISYKFAANFLDKPKTKAVNNGLIGLVIWKAILCS